MRGPLLRLVVAPMLMALIARAALAQSLPGNVQAMPSEQVRDDGAPVVLTGTGVIAGRVTQRGNETVPVTRAFISLMTNGVVRRQVVSDDNGRFWFGNLPAGRYTIRFNKVAYAGTLYGATTARGEGTPIVLAEGQRISDIAQTMVKSNVVTGRVVDESGTPIVGASVTVYERLMVGGKPVFRQSGAGGAVTDDRGVYRFYGFEPGKFLVGVRFLSFGDTSTAGLTNDDEVRWAEQRARSSTTAAENPPPAPKLVKYARAYAPGVTDPNQATVLTFGLAEEKTGVDIVIPLVPTAKISGRLVSPDGAPLVRPSLTIQSVMRDNPQVAQPRRWIADQDGRFSLDDLEPGRYTLLALSQDAAAVAAGPLSAGSGAFWAMSEIQVSGEDISGLTMTLQPAMNISGHVVFDATAGTASAGRVTISVRPPPNGLLQTAGGTVAASADGTFSIRGVTPGPYAVTASVAGPGAASWVPASIVAGGRSVIDDNLEISPGQTVTDLEIHFTDRRTELTGTFLDAAGHRVTEYSVFVFTTNTSMWHQGSRWIRMPVKPTSNGAFSVMGLPPGEYFVAALSRFDPLEWYTPEFMEQVAGAAIRLTLTDGQKLVQDFHVK